MVSSRGGTATALNIGLAALMDGPLRHDSTN
jgi:hypothetical protein